MPGPPLIVFDVNETLSDLGPLDAIFAEIGLPGQRELWFASVLRDGIALAAAGTSARFAEVATERIEAMIRHRSDAADDAADRVLAAFGGLHVHPDVGPGVSALRSAGHRLVTLSNGSAAVAQRLLSRSGLTDRFERLFSVEDAGIWKPAAGAYHYALTSCDVAPVEAVLVAVHPWDIDGAARAGLRTAWLNRADDHYPSYCRAPDVEISSLTDLVDQLGRAAG